MGQHYLDYLFAPNAIAVFGASMKSASVGTRLFQNIIASGFAGPVYPINPKYNNLDQQTCYPSIRAIGKSVDLAVIATPVATIPEIIHECGEQGVRAAIILSAGFEGAQGEAGIYQKSVLAEARRKGIRILGPNCLGLIRPVNKLNATFSKNNAQSGNLALVSQSGALCTAILDWAMARSIGFSAMVSLGNALDIGFGDVLDYLALDPHTESILLYVEGIRDARAFMSGLRIAARMKPVIVLKVGRHHESAHAALSHTGAMVGADDVFDAALRRAGAVRVMTIEQLFSAAQLLATTHRVQGNRLAIVTNGGGPGIMATDRAIDLGVAITQLTETSIQQLNAALPPHWSHGNPIDILGDATPARYRSAVEICLHDTHIDGVLIILTPQAMTKPLQAAKAVIEASTGTNKPVLACWMGEPQVKAARKLFAKHKIPFFPNPDVSVEAFTYLVNYHRNQRLLMQVPEPLMRSSGSDINGAHMIIDGALAERRTTLNSLEARALLTAFGITVMPAISARSGNEALVAAESLGFPIAMKINSPDISHKSDVNGVQLNIANAHAVRGTYNELTATVQALCPNAKIEGVTIERMHHHPHGRELLVGVIRDPVFGPIISFGAGGTMVELLLDHAVAIPPLNDFIITDLINQTRISKLLGQFRNLPAVSIPAIRNVMRRLSEMVCELPRICELDINPLIADENDAVVLDVRVVVDAQAPMLKPYGHMAIHPYPAHLQRQWQLADGTDIIIRPIRPEDAEIEQTFVHNLSLQSKYFRFMQSLYELTPQMLIRFTQIDYDRELAFIAVISEKHRETEIGVARYVTNPDIESCEFALVIADQWQQKGIGSRLLTCLIEAAQAKGFKTMEGEVLANNTSMLRLTKNLGFTSHISQDDPAIIAISKAL
ncbi:acetyltransferase [Nitrosomonas aestuarii]|uniref:Acetyltransferase n=1 Tax=Nitrosomonas aestuarii TaxID=52441 RepID=A0A1I4EYM5_9PROT|nr:bifunctional acetate--CoA ligase family protein/GNAT family N-acetyltransferase [Nitrosomonas aestuarii]SFL10303.1 acetyltransferase [Nitrosomonas aestuarii]